nr:MAG TPA: hypothetical protein [Caudoviricetes sp.]
MVNIPIKQFCCTIVNFYIIFVCSICITKIFLSVYILFYTVF